MKEKLTFEKVVSEVKKDLKEHNETVREKRLDKNKLVCRKCKSENIQVQKISTQVKKKKGLMYWSGGWFIDAMSWIFLTLPRFLIQIFKRDKTVSKLHTEAVCQSCGYSWKV